MESKTASSLFLTKTWPSEEIACPRKPPMLNVSAIHYQNTVDVCRTRLCLETSISESNEILSKYFRAYGSHGMLNQRPTRRPLPPPAHTPCPPRPHPHPSHTLK